MDKTRIRKIIVGVIIAVVVLVYCINPFDLIPDVAVGAGQMDDIGIAILGVIGEVINIVIGKKQIVDMDEI